MPRDLFGDVVHPTAGFGRRKWYTLPLSLVLHTCVLGLVVVVPLLAAGVLPRPPKTVAEWVEIAPSLPPAAPPVTRTAPRLAAAGTPDNPGAAPLVAPSGVAPENGLVVEQTPVDGEVMEGVPNGLTGTTDGLPEVPPPPRPVAPIRVHAGVTAPVKVSHVSPAYPPVALAARVQGVVILEAVIAEDGRVRETRVLRSIPLLDQAAVEAVRQWRFTPALLNGTPVPVVMTVTVSFVLQ